MCQCAGVNAPSATAVCAEVGIFECVSEGFSDRHRDVHNPSMKRAW